MKRLYRWAMSWLTMSRQKYLFTDAVSGGEVFLYRDCYGTFWMAERTWWLGFRVQRSTEGDEG